MRLKTFSVLLVALALPLVLLACNDDDDVAGAPASRDETATQPASSKCKK